MNKRDIDLLMYKKDIDLLRFDFSKAEEEKIDELLENNKIKKVIEEAFNELNCSYAKEYDKAVVKSAFLKAKLYDKNCNPYTVENHIKHKEIQKFCNWMLEHINDANLTKRDIIKELKRYANE